MIGLLWLGKKRNRNWTYRPGCVWPFSYPLVESAAWYCAPKKAITEPLWHQCQATASLKLWTKKPRPFTKLACPRSLARATKVWLVKIERWALRHEWWLALWRVISWSKLPASIAYTASPQSIHKATSQSFQKHKYQTFWQAWTGCWAREKITIDNI